MTNFLKTPVEYAKQLNDCYGPSASVTYIIVDMARAHRQLPMDYVLDVETELKKLRSL